MTLAAFLLQAALPLTAGTADPLFDASVLHETHLILDPADWKALQANYLLDQYYAADLILDGETIFQVGIRSRGLGSRSSEKPGLKVDFDRYVQGQRFRGLGSLVLDNLLQDPSFLKEYLAFQVFEAMGLPAPRVSYTRLTVNGEYWGVYALVEPVKKPFLAARLGDSGGNLFDYEFAFPYDFSYLGNDPARYIPIPFEPETNEDDLDPSRLLAFIQAINEAPDQGYETALAPYLDVERFLTYLAVENAISENDGLVGYEGMNNFYLYQHETSGRFTFIPWDKDAAFHSPTWPLFQRVETNVLTRRLLSDRGLKRFYADACLKAVNDFVNAGWLGPRMEEARTLIREAVLTDGKKPFSNEAFELAILALEEVIEGRKSDVTRQAGGVP